MIDRIAGIHQLRIQETIFKILIYLLLTGMAFTFLLPVMYMGVTSMMSREDILDSSIRWIPTQLTLRNIEVAFVSLKFWEAAKNSLIVAGLSSIFQVISSALIGYSFARMKFRGKELIFMLVLFTFIVPPQTVIIPLFRVYNNLNWIDTYLPFLVPGLVGHGLRGAIFIFIFRQFYKGLPWELEDAALIDGCGELMAWWRIMLPLARPAIVVSFLFSFVWHWNDFYEPMMYLMSVSRFTLPLKLSNYYFTQAVATNFGTGWEVFNVPVIVSGCLLSILPMFILYLFTQRFFVESIERTGLVE